MEFDNCVKVMSILKRSSLEEYGMWYQIAPIMALVHDKKIVLQIYLPLNLYFESLKLHFEYLNSFLVVIFP